MKNNLSRLCAAIARELEEADSRIKRKQAEFQREAAREALQVSEENYRLVVENAMEAIIVTQNVKVVFVNRAAIDMIGYSGDISTSKPFSDFVHPDDLNMVVDHHIRRIKGEKIPPVYSFRVITQDGTVKWVEHNSAVLQWKGKPATLTFLNDVTERKQVEEALRERDVQLKKLTSLVPGMIYQFTKRPDGTYCVPFTTEAIKNIFGCSPQDVREDFSPIARTILPEDFDKVVGSIEYSAKNLTIWTCEYRVQIPGQSIRWISGSSTPEKLADGSITWYGFNTDITERKQAEEERKQSFERLRKALGATVQSISMIVEMKDPYTAGHQQRVSDLARSIATEMGLLADRRDFIRTASAIHDIGKIFIPTEILSKPTKLIEVEFSLIKTHAQSGYDILKDIEFPWPVADVVLQHHERMDGSGYPQGLKGENILLEARILAIADVVEAIASHRPYRPSRGIDFALEEISGNRGILYDAGAVDACLKLFLEGYTLVR